MIARRQQVATSSGQSPNSNAQTGFDGQGDEIRIISSPPAYTVYQTYQPDGVVRRQWYVILAGAAHAVRFERDGTDAIALVDYPGLSEPLVGFGDTEESAISDLTQIFSGHLAMSAGDPMADWTRWATAH